MTLFGSINELLSYITSIFTFDLRIASRILLYCFKLGTSATNFRPIIQFYTPLKTLESFSFSMDIQVKHLPEKAWGILLDAILSY